MKKLMILFAMAIMSSIAMAQSETTRTIHGAVVDKNGNPLPGAVVSATEGAETTLVNSDGTFDLEIPIWLKSVTASYPGYMNKRMKPLFDQDMIFRLDVKKRRGFLNGYFGITSIQHGYAGALGLMGGLLNDIGFYGKAGITMGGNIGVAVGGVTKKIYKNIYAYLGIGYGGLVDDELIRISLDGGGILEYTEYYYYSGMGFDGGFIFKIGRHFDITVGFTETTDFDYDNSTFNFSLGYVF